MNIPWERLQSDTLNSMIEEFVSRDGTDYGVTEVPHERKVEQVLQLLKSGEMIVTYDAESESCNLRNRENELEKLL